MAHYIILTLIIYFRGDHHAYLHSIHSQLSSALTSIEQIYYGTSVVHSPACRQGDLAYHADHHVDSSLSVARVLSTTVRLTGRWTGTFLGQHVVDAASIHRGIKLRPDQLPDLCIVVYSSLRQGQTVLVEQTFC
jgi:hypothetical protein